MYNNAGSIDIASMARQLQLRRKNKLKTVLVLGARAGGLIRSQRLYDELQSFFSHGFSNLSRNSQFARFYHLLARPESSFSNAHIQTMLSSALTTVALGEVDEKLARLIQQGYFDPIITTNADTLLEQALFRAGWQELQDFEVINLVSETSEHIFFRGAQPACTIIKVFGELTARNYLLDGRYVHMYNRQVMALESKLRQDCLVVGFDDVWDATLDRVFPPQGDQCWVVAEEMLDEYSPFYRIGGTRQVRSLVDNQHARYENFIVELYNALTTISGTNTSLIHPPPQVQVSVDVDNQPAPLEIFISYHPKDEEYLNKLISHLAAMKHQRLISDWFDRKIEAGQSYSQEIQLHLDRAAIILLLVSDDFIASKNLYFGVVEQAMQLHRAKKARVIPVLLRPVDWKTTIFGDLSPLPDDNKFVTQWNDLDEAFLNLSQGIRRVVDACR